MPDAQDELSQSEKREVIKNDLRVARERASTFSQFAESEAAEPRGRFTTHDQATVIGVSPPSYPQLPASSPWAGPDPVPAENPLGVDVNEMQPCGEPHEVRASIAAQVSPSEPSHLSGAQGIAGDPADAPPNNDPLASVERAGSPSFSNKRR